MGSNPSVGPPHLNESGHSNCIEDRTILDNHMEEFVEAGSEVDADLYANWVEDSQYESARAQRVHHGSSKAEDGSDS